MIRYRGKYIVAGSRRKGLESHRHDVCGGSRLRSDRIVRWGLMSEQNILAQPISNFVYLPPIGHRYFAMCDQVFRGPQGERVSLTSRCNCGCP